MLVILVPLTLALIIATGQWGWALAYPGIGYGAWLDYRHRHGRKARPQ